VAEISDATLTENNLISTATVYCGNVGIEEDEKENFPLKIFPNPVSENFQITIPQNFRAEKVLITDVDGKIIYSKTISRENQLMLDVSSFPNGIYSVQLNGGDKGASGKLVVMH